jgi:hypothetical protein
MNDEDRKAFSKGGLPPWYSADPRAFRKPKKNTTIDVRIAGKNEIGNPNPWYLNAQTRLHRGVDTELEFDRFSSEVDEEYASAAFSRTDISREDFKRDSAPESKSRTDFDLYLRSKAIYGQKAVRSFCAWKAMRDDLKTRIDSAFASNRFAEASLTDAVAKGTVSELCAPPIAHPKYAIGGLYDVECGGCDVLSGNGTECQSEACSTDLTLSVCVNPLCCKGTLFKVNLENKRWYENLCAVVSEMVSAQMDPLSKKSSISGSAETIRTTGETAPITGVRLSRDGRSLPECLKERGARFLASPAIVRVEYDNRDDILRDYLKKGKCVFSPLAIPEKYARFELRSDDLRDKFCESVSAAFWTGVHSEVRSNITAINARVGRNLDEDDCKPRLTEAKLDLLVSECTKSDGKLQKICDTFGCKEEILSSNVGTALKESYFKFAENHDAVFSEYAKVRSGLHLDKKMLDTQSKLTRRDESARERFSREENAIRDRIAGATRRLGDEPAVVGKVFHDYYELEKPAIKKAIEFVTRRSEAGLETKEEGLIHPKSTSHTSTGNYEKRTKTDVFQKNRESRDESAETSELREAEIKRFERSLGLSEEQVHEAERATTRTMAHVNKLLVDLEKREAEKREGASTTPTEPVYEKKSINPFKKVRTFDEIEKRLRDTMGLPSKDGKENMDRLAESIVANCAHDEGGNPDVPTDWPKTMSKIRREASDPFESGAKKVYHRSDANPSSIASDKSKGDLKYRRTAESDVGCPSEKMHRPESTVHSEKRKKKEEKKRKKEEKKRKKKLEKNPLLETRVLDRDAETEDLAAKMERHARVVEGAFSASSSTSKSPDVNGGKSSSPLQLPSSSSVNLKVNLDTDFPAKSSTKPKCLKKSEPEEPEEKEKIAPEEEEEIEEKIGIDLKVNLETDFPSKSTKKRSCPKAKPIVPAGTEEEEESGASFVPEEPSSTEESPREENTKPEIAEERREEKLKDREAETSEKEEGGGKSGRTNQKYDKMIREVIESDTLYRTESVFQSYEEKAERIGFDLKKSTEFVGGKMDVLVIYHDFGDGKMTSYGMFFDQKTSLWTSWAGLDPNLETIPESDLFRVDQNFLGEIFLEVDPEDPNSATLRGNLPPQTMTIHLECKLFTNSRGSWMVGVCHPKDHVEAFLDMFGNINPYGRTS